MASGQQEVVVAEEVQANNNEHSRRSSKELRILINQETCTRCHTRSSSDNDWLRRLQNEKHAATNSTPPTNNEKPKIQKVPKRRREVTGKAEKCYYDPLVVSIGPIHHGKDELGRMEKIKRFLARKYADACYEKKGVDIYQLYDKVEEIAESARSCYAEGLTKQYDHKTFAHMMFLDGCFVLQYIYSTVVVEGDFFAELKMKSDDIAFVRSDLMLLENQLPFQVLQVLMRCRLNEDEGMKMIKKFIKNLRPDPPIHKKKPGFVTCIKNLFIDLCDRNTPQEKALLLGHGPMPTDPAHLLELLRARLINCRAFSGSVQRGSGELFSYRSVTELKKVGIRFCPARIRCFSDIEFRSSSLILPTVTIDDASKTLFLNLVAYEACPDTRTDFGVSSFLCFMDSLIDDAEDVKELRSKGVLFNLLGSDQDVAELFNEISRDLVPNPKAYIQAKRDIQKYYENKGRVWITEWKNTHFSSPWTVLAFLAAIFVIALDIIQTVFTGIQTFKKDPKS